MTFVSVFFVFGGSMSGYQFLHDEVYSPVASKLTGSKKTAKGGSRTSGGTLKSWNAREVLAEALRELGACSHVPSPKPPTTLTGDLQRLADDLDAWVKPSKQRKDTPIMIAGVISAPWPPDDPRSDEWRKDTLDYLKKTYGADLHTVIAHEDEAYDHLHFYVCKKNFQPVKPLHAGYAAQAQAKADGASPKDQDLAYKKAMKAMQDDFYAQVSQRHGHARKGPGRARLGRAEWRDVQDDNKARAERLKQIEAGEVDLAKNAIQLKALEHQLAKQAEEVERQSQMLAVEKARQAQEKIELAKAMESITKKELLVMDREQKVVKAESVLQQKMQAFYAKVQGVWARITGMEKRELTQFLSSEDRQAMGVEPKQQPRKSGLDLS